MADDRGIPLKERFQEGNIVHVSPTAVDLQLDAQRYGRIVRVHREHFEKPQADGGEINQYVVGARVPVFLRHTSAVDPSLRYGSFKWSRPGTNPWVQHTPMLGDVIELEVTRHAGDGIYCVCKPLGESSYGDIEILIHKNELPGRHNTISEYVDVGDHIEAEVIEVNENHLLITASVNRAIQNYQQSVLIQRLKQTEVISLLPLNKWRRKNSWPGAKDVSVAIFLKDRYFAEHLSTWLVAAGFSVIRVDTVPQLEAALTAEDAPTRLVMSRDRLSESLKVHSGVKRLLRNMEIKVIWLGTKDPDINSDVSQCLNTPFVLAELCCMLTEQSQKTSYKSIKEPYLSENYALRNMQKKAETLLSKICSELRFDSAFWVKRVAHETYEVRATHNLEGIDWKPIQEQLYRSQIEDALVKNERVLIDIDGRNVLSRVSSAQVDKAFIVPILELEDDSKHVSRSVVFFYRSNNVKSGFQDYLDPYVWAMRAMVEAYEQAKRGDNMLSFYSMGRNASAYLHEVRESVNNILNTVSVCAEQRSLHGSILDSEWTSLKHQMQHLKDLSEYELGQIKQHQNIRVSLKSLIKHTAQILRYNFSKVGCDLIIEVPDMPLMINVAPVVVMQTIRNIIDNALYFVKGAPRKKMIKINVDLCGQVGVDQYAGLRIDIEDNGPGIRSTFMPRLFQPRESTKGNAGSGLGLNYFRSMINEVGGDIKLDQRVRWKRTRFRIILPLILDGN